MVLWFCMEAEMSGSSGFHWGGLDGELIEKHWRRGDTMWEVGDAVEGPELRRERGIVQDVIERRRMRNSTIRITYAVACP